MSINNVLSDRNMDKEVKVTESELEDIYNLIAEATMVEIKRLEDRIIRMERAFDALSRRLEGSARHPEDEGWFD